jgi:hypothetical protein
VLALALHQPLMNIFLLQIDDLLDATITMDLQLSATSTNLQLSALAPDLQWSALAPRISSYLHYHHGSAAICTSTMD